MRIVRLERVCLESETEASGIGVVACVSGLFIGGRAEALDGCWVGEQLGFAKEGLSVGSRWAGFNRSMPNKSLLRG